MQGIDLLEYFSELPVWVDLLLWIGAALITELVQRVALRRWGAAASPEWAVFWSSLRRPLTMSILLVLISLLTLKVLPQLIPVPDEWFSSLTALRNICLLIMFGWFCMRYANRFMRLKIDTALEHNNALDEEDDIGLRQDISGIEALGIAFQISVALIISFLTTTVRTFDKRPLTIPNSLFNSIVVINAGRMTNRRIYEQIPVTAPDAEAIRQITRSVKTLVEMHSAVDPQQTLIVNHNGWDADGRAKLMVYAILRTTNWVRYHGIKQHILLEIQRIIEEHGAGVSAPRRELAWSGGLQEQSLNAPISLSEHRRAVVRELSEERRVAEA